jgi:(R,R)-butanediol dehydrogenase/meso-butanediol dehydrogenase/diacetyl reductase
MGHEFTGTIEAVGADVKGFKEGDRIVSEASLPCGRCAHCMKGEFILCREPAYLGFAWDGAFADSCTVPADICHLVPTGLKSQDAVLIEPLASAMHAVRRGNVSVGNTVAIVGTGTIGLSTLLCARAAGATHVYTFEKVPSKRAKALEMGATEAWDPGDGDPVDKIRDATHGKGVDVAFECVGTTLTVALATRCTKVHGRTVVIGVSVEEQPFSFLDILLNEREVCGTAGYFGEFEICMDLVADGRIKPQSLITANIALEEIVQKGFEPFSSPANENVKIVVNIGA